MGFKYKLESILASELRVLKTLDYIANIPTPFSYVELLLEVLSRKIPEFEAKHLYYICVSMFYKYYNKREKIYAMLYETVTGRTKDLSGK